VIPWEAGIQAAGKIRAKLVLWKRLEKYQIKKNALMPKAF